MRSVVSYTVIETFPVLLSRWCVQNSFYPISWVEFRSGPYSFLHTICRARHRSSVFPLSRFVSFLLSSRGLVSTGYPMGRLSLKLKETAERRSGRQRRRLKFHRTFLSNVLGVAVVTALPQKRHQPANLKGQKKKLNWAGHRSLGGICRVSVECFWWVYRKGPVLSEKLDLTKFFLQGNQAATYDACTCLSQSNQHGLFPKLQAVWTIVCIQTALSIHDDMYDKHTGDKHVSGFRELKLWCYIYIFMLQLQPIVIAAIERLQSDPLCQIT